MKDLELIEKAQNGDKAALEKLLVLYQPDIRQFAKSACKTKEDAEDAIQHTMYVMFKSINSFRAASKFTTWLFSIVKFECLKLLKKLKPKILKQEISYAPSSEKKVSEREIHELVVGSILKLDAISKEVIILRDIEGLSAPEVATQLNISPKAVKSRLHRARQIIKMHLIESGISLE